MSVIRECGLSDTEDLLGNVDANGYTRQKQLLVLMPHSHQLNMLS